MSTSTSRRSLFQAVTLTQICDEGADSADSAFREYEDGAAVAIRADSLEDARAFALAHLAEPRAWLEPRTGDIESIRNSYRGRNGKVFEYEVIRVTPV